MTLRNDFSFTGYIRVELELVRPITVREMADKCDDIFYLPKNTVKAIYLASSNTASQVIKALLQKVCEILIGKGQNFRTKFPSLKLPTIPESLSSANE